MKIHHIKYKYLLLLWAVMFATGCSTQKNKFANRLYHNTTTHYNVWWNGNESLKEAKKQLDTKTIDDYTQILSVYRLGTKENAISVYPLLDRTLEKGATGVQKHSIFIKGKEYVTYVKKSYLMMAYAHFYKQDYQAAILTCRYVMGQYAGTDIADEAKILYARSLTHDKQYTDAEMLLDQMDAAINSGKMSAKMADLLYPAMVECLLPQEKYKKAVDFIRLSLDNTSNKKQKARLYFIMAQIYHKLDKKTTATKYYKKALSMRPNYVMEFNAKMNIASCYDISKGDYKGIEKILDKMLADKKNCEFIDQIYYAKGEMYLGAKNAKKACENFEKSIAVSTTNKSQKIKSALKLADVLYDVYQNYDEAQKYYDTALVILPQDYPDADFIKERHRLLTSLVENTRVIALNDSLFMLADMNPVDREKYIQTLIAKQKEIDEKKKEEAIEAALQQELKTSMQNTLVGDWYFYNSSTVQKGKESFMRVWGTRELEDYWFLSQKPGVSLGISTNELFANTEDTEATDSTMASTTQSATNAADDKYSVDYYLKDLPKTQGRRDSMHEDIARCLLNAGFIYDAGIENQEKALECFLRLVDDYQGTDYVLPAFYQLYKIYDKQGNTPSANYYRNMILRGFPDSDYANLIRDEDYYLEMAKRNKMAETEYEDIYQLFAEKRYHQVIVRTSAAVQIYTKEEGLIPKYKYWNAIALAKTNKTSEAISMLEEIESKYPKSEITPLVSEQVKLLKNGFKQTSDDETIDENSGGKTNKPTTSTDVSASKVNDELPPESQLYRYRENLQHYVIFILDDEKMRATEMQYAVSDFNMAYYSAKALKTNVMLLTADKQLITVHKFDNAADALDYWKYLTTKASDLERFDKKYYTSFVISVQNYQTFYNKKNVEAYRKFFEKYYINKE